MGDESGDSGVVPPTNDLVAAVVIVATYISRFGVLAEGAGGSWWHAPLLVTTDVVLPLAAGLWLLVVPVWSVWTRCRRE